MRSLARIVFLLSSTPALLAAAETTAATGDPVDFAHEIVPILKNHCGKCHTAGTYKGDLSLDTRAALLKSKVVVPGDAGKSELITRITSTDADVQMPPTGERLTSEQVALLTRWINQNVPWQDGFSFARTRSATGPLALKRPELLPAESGRTSALDCFAEVYFTQNHLTFPAPVDDATFARRVYLDLTGLLPTLADLERFQADTLADKRDRLIDDLLSDKVAYADHWLTFWNDLLRNDYAGTGYIDGGRKQITKWLYTALLENKRYDQFVRELIAPSDQSEGFIKGIKWRGNVNAAQSVEMQFSQNVGQVFLGVNLKCASCHDSFIDDWKLTDSWGLAAAVADRQLEIYRCDVPTGVFAEPKFLFQDIGAVDADSSRERLQQLAKLITDPRNGRLPRTLVNRLWQRMLGHGIIHPVDAMDGAPWSAELLDYLASELVDQNYDIKKILRLIASSQIYQARCAEPLDPASSEAPVAQLILDLEQRGLLDRTLVVLASEFSRDMMIEGVPGSTANALSRGAIHCPRGRKETTG
jgi:mono/diheme cytochrome c family protein